MVNAGVAELADARDLKSRGSDTRTGSIPVAGSNVYGCKPRFYLSLQPLSLFYTFGTNQYNFGTSQKISAFE